MLAEQQTNSPAILALGFGKSEACLGVVSGLLGRGFPVIAACASDDSMARNLALAAGCIPVEAGRGGDLRAGLTYFSRYMQELPGIVVWDTAGGYSLEDVLKAAAALLSNRDKFVIASRSVGAGAGQLARLEKFLGFLAFAAIQGRPIKDPWAGLTALPAALVPVFLGIKGDGRKYEFNIVLNLQHKGVRAVNVPVNAEYSLGEASGFWERAGDILRVLFLPLKFISSSLMAMGSDYCIRFLTYGVFLPGNEPVSVAIGRFTGALVNYLVNRNVVFRHKNDSIRMELATLTKFVALATFNYFASLLLIQLFMSLGISFYIASPMADAVLYAPNYLIQRDVVFRKKRIGG